MEAYAQQRQNSFSYKASTAIGGLFSINKPKASPSLNLNSTEESTSEKNDYQNSFLSTSNEQQSLKLYNTVIKEIDSMKDKETTVKATFKIATLLTKENEDKSPNLFKVIQKISETLRVLIDYKFDLLYMHVFLNRVTPDYQVPFLECEAPILIKFTYKNEAPSQLRIYGCKNGEWQFTDLDCELPRGYNSDYHFTAPGTASVLPANSVLPKIFQNILIHNGHACSGQYKDLVIDSLKNKKFESELDSLQKEMMKAIDVYLTNYLYIESPEQRAKLKAFDSALTVYESVCWSPDIEWQKYCQIFNLAGEDRNLRNLVKLNFTVEKTDFFTRLKAYSNDAFVEPLCDMLKKKFGIPERLEPESSSAISNMKH
jgi:hypothetical protein